MRFAQHSASTYYEYLGKSIRFHMNSSPPVTSRTMELYTELKKLHEIVLKTTPGSISSSSSSCSSSSPSCSSSSSSSSSSSFSSLLLLLLLSYYFLFINTS